MSLNRSLLTQITEDLKNKKKPSKPRVPRNQWQHPGEVTTIPSNNITMDGVSYPVLGVPNVGPAQMMQPDGQYHFPGAANVTEYPMMQPGGSTNYWMTDRGKWVDSVNHANMDKNFVQRMYLKNGPQIYLPGSKKPSTHYMESADGRAYPTVVQRPGNKFVEWLNQSDPNGAYRYAMDTGQYIQFPNDEQAIWYGENGYKIRKGVTIGKKQNGGVPKMQFAGAVSTNALLQNINKPKTPQELAAHRQRIYNTIRPSDYYDQNNYMRYIFNNQREDRDDVRSEEGFRQYLGLNTKPQFITPAVYRPTQAKNPNAKYYKVDKALEQDLFDSFYDKVKLGETMGTDEFQVVHNIPYIKRLADQGLYNEENNSYHLTKTDQKLKRSEYESRARVLGNFTVSHGKDDKGEYLSYYDTYDFPGLIQKQMQGTPYELYGRIYYPKKAKGGQTRDEREMVNGIADILSQVDNEENRERIARKMMDDFERENVTYNPEKFIEMSKLKNGGQHGGLDRWFAEKWVDIKTGKPCGRQEGESRAGYPACRPSKRVNSDTPKTAGELSGSEKARFKREKTSSKRIDYNHKKEEGGSQYNWLEKYN